MTAALTPLQRVRLGTQNDLTVFEIAILTFGQDATYRAWLTGELLTAIKAGTLPAHGHPDGWFITRGPGPQSVTPYPRCEGHQGSPVPGSPPGSAMNAPPHPFIGYRLKLPGDWCVVNRADYLAFRENRLDIPKPDWPAIHAQRPVKKTRNQDEKQNRNDQIKATAAAIRAERKKAGLAPFSQETVAGMVMDRLNLSHPGVGQIKRIIQRKD